MSEMKEKLHTGELYLPGDEEIMKEHDKAYYFKDRKIALKK